MNENINLTKILKDCPKGTKFYSPLYGDVKFISITNDGDYPIKVEIVGRLGYKAFTKEGFYYNYYNKIECLLFPSKDQRDWSKWKCPKPKFDPKTLKPFDRVLGRCRSNERWCCEFFSFMRDKSYGYPYVGVGGAYEYCIPYNDDTKHLVGTTEEAPEFYKYWED